MRFVLEDMPTLAVATGMAAKNMPTQAWAWRPAGRAKPQAVGRLRDNDEPEDALAGALQSPIPAARHSLLSELFSSAGGFSAAGLLAGFRAGGETGPYFFADNSVR